MQMAFADPNASLNAHKRIGEQIADAVAATKTRGLSSETPRDCLVAVGLDPGMVTRYPYQFCGGQPQRSAIARALAARSDLLVAGEPISALDASSQAEVASMMREVLEPPL